MREIKFRAWNRKDKWMEDFFWVSSAGMAFDSASQTYDTPNTEIEESLNLIVMQYTGLKDEQGVKLYDGDIYWKWGERFVCNFEQVVYEKHECLIFDGDFLIVGNIYENPELLERSK